MTTRSAKQLSYEDIRRFRVRIPGGVLRTRWPNGKASDYEVLSSFFAFFARMYVCTGLIPTIFKEVRVTT